MLDSLADLDRAVFCQINGSHNPFMDKIMLAVTRTGDASFFVPAALLSILFILRKRTSWPLLVLIALTVILSDQTAYHLKHAFQRVRPSHTLAAVHLITGPGGRYSFPSNHATNAFAIATLLGFFFRRPRLLFFGLAALVAHSRVYLGLHYPGDVLAGALLGALIGLGCACLFKTFERRYPRLFLGTGGRSDGAATS